MHQRAMLGWSRGLGLGPGSVPAPATVSHILSDLLGLLRLPNRWPKTIFEHEMVRTHAPSASNVHFSLLPYPFLGMEYSHLQ